MSKIAQAFARGKAFIPFITCGDPNLETTAAAVRAAVENGADLIELGIPFSDPTAEGPVIQGANLRALQGGVTTDQIFGLVRDLRRDVTIPLVFMTYANVVYSYGTEHFVKKENGAVLMNDTGRKTMISVWQGRKRDKIKHPFLGDKIEWGLLPHVQALLLARFIRGDLDEYPVFLWK